MRSRNRRRKTMRRMRERSMRRRRIKWRRFEGGAVEDYKIITLIYDGFCSSLYFL